MDQQKKVRCKWLTVRLNADEEKKLLQLFDKTTSGSLSEYARDVLLHEPVTILYRNQSADALLFEMIQLKNELNAFGNNFNQAVKKLHTLDQISELKIWAISNESVRNAFMQKTVEIKEKLDKIYRQWSQE